ELKWIPARRALISEFAENDSPNSRAPGSSPRLPSATQCGFMMPIELTLDEKGLGRLWNFGALSWKRRSLMAQVVAKFPPRSDDNHSFGIPDFEPLLNSYQAAQLLDIHHKTLQKLARVGEIHDSDVRKPWRYRSSDLNECL